mmetsp:Transcript_18112/g.29381  ORF Transcript_18112/g.29381 Transcript_18112/m.29381 type:complete len:173 (-) Transcript_18112:33-551(-)
MQTVVQSLLLGFPRIHSRTSTPDDAQFILVLLDCKTKTKLQAMPNSTTTMEKVPKHTTRDKFRSIAMIPQYHLLPNATCRSLQKMAKGILNMPNLFEECYVSTKQIFNPDSTRTSINSFVLRVETRQVYHLDLTRGPWLSYGELRMSLSVLLQAKMSPLCSCNRHLLEVGVK